MLLSLSFSPLSPPHHRRSCPLVQHSKLLYTTLARPAAQGQKPASMEPEQFRPSSAQNTPYMTTNSGMPVWNNNASTTVGSRGPILLEDYQLVEKLAQFDRERIPERVVHARGASAKGFFEVRQCFLDEARLKSSLVPAVHTYSIKERQSTKPNPWHR